MGEKSAVRVKSGMCSATVPFFCVSAAENKVKYCVCRKMKMRKH